MGTGLAAQRDRAGRGWSGRIGCGITALAPPAAMPPAAERKKSRRDQESDTVRVLPTRHPAVNLLRCPTVELSLVVPAYNERENLAPLLAEIDSALTGRSYEVIVVDDGSSDGSVEALKALRRQYPQLRVIAFERNAGQTAAFAAGFRAARAPIVGTLGADPQNDPADIPTLVDTLQRSGAPPVAGHPAPRRDTPWKRLQSRIANGVRNRLNGEVIRDTGCSLKAFRTDAVKALPLFTGLHRFLPTLIKLQGGTVTEIAVGHRPRKYGVTKYGMWNRVLRSLVDAVAVRWIQRRALRYRVKEEV